MFRTLEKIVLVVVYLVIFGLVLAGFLFAMRVLLSLPFVMMALSVLVVSGNPVAILLYPLILVTPLVLAIIIYAGEKTNMCIKDGVVKPHWKINKEN